MLECWGGSEITILIFTLSLGGATHWFIFVCLCSGWAPSLTSLMVILWGQERFRKVVTEVQCDKKRTKSEDSAIQWLPCPLRWATAVCAVFKTPFLILWNHLGKAWLDETEIYKTTERIEQPYELFSFILSTNNNAAPPLFLVTGPNFLSLTINWRHILLRNILSILTWLWKQRLCTALDVNTRGKTACS